MNLPEAFVQQSQSLLENEFSAFEQALNESPPVSIRINNKTGDTIIPDSKVPWCDSGFYLRERPGFTADPLFHAGAYYVQEASSMFLQQIVRQFLTEAERILDLCAAPGGKSTLLSQETGDSSLLVSNEINRSRAMILAENSIKWGNSNVVVTNNTPADFDKLPGFFDAIVIDAPCSGEGMFRKDPEAISEWSLQNVKHCAIRQKDILNDVWNSLKEGGILVYSTCTYNREENEENVAWIGEQLGAEILTPDISNFPEITQNQYGCRFFPHKTRGEGFFISVLKKTAEAPHSGNTRNNRKTAVKISGKYDELLSDPEHFTIVEDDNCIRAYPKTYIHITEELKKKLNCLEYGILLFDKKGKDLIPAHQLAMSKHIRITAFNTSEVDYQTAISFLKKENIFLPDAPKGYILVTYKKLPLGWVKNLGNRCNNLYPQHWRIRMNIEL